MASKYKIGLFLNGLCLILCFFVLASYLIYQKELEEKNPLVIVANGLSINFMQGKNIKINKENEKYTFSITNDGEEASTYYIYLENINSNSFNVLYDLKEQNNKLNITKNEVSKDSNYLANFIEIKAKETHFYELTLYNANKQNFNAEIMVGIVDNQEEYFANTILKDNKVKKESQTKIGEEIANADEGLIESTDDYGITYYFRGNVQNNYVEFANFTWRIVKINGDGSIKLVLNNYLDNTANFYGSEEKSIEDKLDFAQSNINKTLENWYQENIKEYEKDLISHKYCIDTTIGKKEENQTYYLGEARLKTDYTQSFNCQGINNSMRIGLLSADEAVFAGTSAHEDNTNFYLYVPDKQVSWWTATPDRSDETNVVYFEVSNSGKLQGESLGSYFRGVRPVINLVKKTIVTGSGSSTDPYKIKE